MLDSPRRLTITPEAFRLLQTAVTLAQQAQAQANLAVSAVLAAQGVTGSCAVELEAPTTLLLTSPPAPSLKEPSHGP